MAAARRTTEAGMASTPSKESETAGFIDGILADKNREVQEFEEEYAFTPADLDFRNFTTDAAAVRGRIRFADVKDEYSNLWAAGSRRFRGVLFGEFRPVHGIIDLTVWGRIGGGLRWLG